MRKALFAIAICLIAALACTAVAETNLNPAFMGEDPEMVVDETWVYAGWLEGGITWAIPRDSEQWELNDEDAARGVVYFVSDQDYSLQLRAYEPEAMTFGAFRDRMTAAGAADRATRTVGETEVFSYRNPAPSAYAELYGIAVTGLDGRLYKISIFTGDSERFDEDAPVWKIAEVIARSVRIQDFSEWGVNAD